MGKRQKEREERRSSLCKQQRKRLHCDVRSSRMSVVRLIVCDECRPAMSVSVAMMCPLRKLSNFFSFACVVRIAILVGKLAALWCTAVRRARVCLSVSCAAVGVVTLARVVCRVLRSFSSFCAVCITVPFSLSLTRMRAVAIALLAFIAVSVALVQAHFTPHALSKINIENIQFAEQTNGVSK